MGKGQKHRMGPVRPGKGGSTKSKPDSSKGRPTHRHRRSNPMTSKK